MMNIQCTLNIVVTFVETQNIENRSPTMEADLPGHTGGVPQILCDWLLGSKGNEPWGQNYKIVVIQFSYFNLCFLCTYVLVVKLDPKDTKINRVKPCP